MSDRQAQPLQRDGTAVKKERLYRLLFAGCAALTLFVTVGIILALITRTISFFTEVSIFAYLTGTTWSPKIEGLFGVLPLISGTLIITAISALIALPVGLAIAIYLSEYASRRVRAILKPTLEILAAVPTVVYGYFALVHLTPVLDKYTPLDLGTFNALSGGIVVGLIIIPMVSSISEDAISSVPDSLRNAAYGLGSTKFDVSTKVVVPAATSGIVSSYVLALSRAIGETMAVTIAAGLSPKMPYFPGVLNNLENSVQTITAAMVKIAGAESRSGVLLDSMFALGMTLFVLTLLMNIGAEAVRRQFREEYN
ncbi:MAG: phosphate ABC transporter permease subunit PstC [Halonotius sp.]